MFRIKWCVLVLIGLLPLPTARAGDKPAADEPAVVVRVKSLDAVLQNSKLLATLIGRESFAQSIEESIKTKLSAKGLKGIDLDRPIGAYLRFGEDLSEFSATLLVPVGDPKAFLVLLEDQEMSPKLGKNDIYTLQTKWNIDLYLRFAKKYAYVSINTENLSDKKLREPAEVLAGADDSLITVTVRLDQVSNAYKIVALGALEQELGNLQDKVLEGQTETQQKFTKATIKQFSQTAADVFKDGQRLRFDVSFDKNKKDLALQLSLTAKPNTELARTIDASGKMKSPFAALMGKDAAFRGSVDATFPTAVHETFTKALQEWAEKSLADVSNPAKRKQAQALVDAIMPTVKTGELDGFFGMSGPVNKHYTLLAAVKVKDGDQLGTVVHDLVAAEQKNMPSEQQKKIELDAATVGAVKIHRFELPRDAKTTKPIDDLPGDPNLFVAFRKDAVFLAIGPHALTTLKAAVVTEGARAAPLFLFDFNAAQLAPALAQTAEQKELAAKLFPEGKDARVRLSIEGGEAVTMRLVLNLDVLEFFAKLKAKE
jgi:hypothetical protein